MASDEKNYSGGFMDLSKFEAMRREILITAALSCLWFTGNAHAAQLFATTVGGDFYSVDIGTGAPTLIGNSGFADVSGLDHDPTTGKYFGWTVGENKIEGQLFEIDPNTGAGVAVSAGPTWSRPISDITIDPAGTIYGISHGSVHEIVTIDKTDGSTTFVNTVDIHRSGLAVRDATSLWAGNGAPGDLWNVNRATGLGVLFDTPGPMFNMLENYLGSQLLAGDRSGGGTDIYAINTNTFGRTLLSSVSGVTLSGLAYVVPVPAAGPLALAALALFAPFARRRRRGDLSL